METILVLGNPLVKEDSLAVNIIPKLKEIFPKIKFVHVDPTESLEEFGQNLTIIDVVKGISKPIVITDVKKLKNLNVNSMHDFDLTYNLKILLETKRINSVKIFGLPQEAKENEILEWLKKNIKT